MLLFDQFEGVCRCLALAMPVVVRESAMAAAFELAAIAGEETLLAVFPGVDVKGETASMLTSRSSLEVEARRTPAICTLGKAVSVRRRFVGRSATCSGAMMGDGPSGF